MYKIWHKNLTILLSLQLLEIAFECWFWIYASILQPLKLIYAGLLGYTDKTHYISITNFTSVLHSSDFWKRPDVVAIFKKVFYRGRHGKNNLRTPRSKQSYNQKLIRVCKKQIMRNKSYFIR
uniref:Uncharacterized protein n=1 Tax=Micrurus corallinus TaxID=54390 RepID=A0A2D4GWN2_MICCO